VPRGGGGAPLHPCRGGGFPAGLLDGEQPKPNAHAHPLPPVSRLPACVGQCRLSPSLPSLAVPGRTMEGTRIALRRVYNGHVLSIVTPSHHGRWELFEEELQHAWSALTTQVMSRTAEAERYGYRRI
jgi:hypothetical protein